MLQFYSLEAVPYLQIQVMLPRGFRGPQCWTELNQCSSLSCLSQSGLRPLRQLFPRLSLCKMVASDKYYALFLHS